MSQANNNAREHSIRSIMETLMQFATPGRGFLHYLGSIQTWRVLLTFVSATTTWFGMTLLYDVFGADHGAGSIGWLRFIIPLAMAGSIHVAIFWALGQWVGTKRLKFLSLAIPLQMVAVAASYGTHWTHMQGGSVTAQNYLAAQTGVIRGLMSFVQSYRSLADETKALADHSQTEAAIEARTGTSCETNAGKGRGPRFRLRMTDKDTYTSFNTQIADRMKRLQGLADEATNSSAKSADDAMAKLGGLRKVVDEAKGFETDPLLPALQKSASERMGLGRKLIENPAAAGRGSKRSSFMCPDALLDNDLQAVVAAVDALKPVPEADVQDARDPQVGFALALRRVITSIFGTHLLPATREELKGERESLLLQKQDGVQGIQSGDVPPLIVAIVIEAVLTLLFWIDGGTLPIHPGLASLNVFLRRRAEHIIPLVWKKLGGGSKPGALRTALDRHAKFDSDGMLVVLPLYSDDADVRTLHHLMEILTAVKLAKRYYTGSRLLSMFVNGWDAARKSRLAAGGPVRIYRMTQTDYLALLLDMASTDLPADANASSNKSTTVVEEGGAVNDNTQLSERARSA